MKQHEGTIANPVFKRRVEGEPPTAFEIAVILQGDKRLRNNLEKNSEYSRAKILLEVLSPEIREQVAAVQMLRRALKRHGMDITVTNTKDFEAWQLAWETVDLYKRLKGKTNDR